MCRLLVNSQDIAVEVVDLGEVVILEVVIMEGVMAMVGGAGAGLIPDVLLSWH